MEIQANQTTFRSYLFFWLGQLVSLLGSSIANFVIIWWITLLTESTLYLSIAFLVGLVPTVILSPFAGVLADRWSRRKLVGTVDFLQALTTLGLIFLFWLDLASIWLVLVLLGLKGIFQAFHRPTVSAITPSMVPKDKLSRMNGLNFLFTGAVNLVGPVVAAFLLEFWKINQILWIDAITFVAALVPLLLVRIPSVGNGKERSSFVEEFREGLSYIRNVRGFVPLILLSTVLNFLLTPLNTLFPYFVRFDHSGGAGDLAFVLAMAQGGMLAGGLLMSVFQGFKKKMVTIIFFMYVFFFGYSLVALAPPGLFWFIGLNGLIMLFCLPVVNVLYMTIIQTIVPTDMQGRVNSVDMALSSAASPLGMILFGAIAEFTGATNLFLGCTISGMVVLALSWFFTDVRYVEKTDGASPIVGKLDIPLRHKLDRTSEN